MSLEYELSFAGVPFCLDEATGPENVTLADAWYGERAAAGVGEGRFDILADLERLLPAGYLHNFAMPSPYPGRGLGGLALPNQSATAPSPQLRPYDWYYPTTASRWSVFRGLMTSAMYKEVLRQTGGRLGKTFVMKARPEFAGVGAESAYTLSTTMHLLEGRPLSEHGGAGDGLYCITLVDERYYWQFKAATLRVTRATAWADLIAALATALGASISYSAVEAAYSQPDPDSQFWSNRESAALLLDAVCYNLSRTLVRELDGTYTLLTTVESRDRIVSNRGSLSSLVRAAGGDLFNSGNSLAVGSLFNARNAVVPEAVEVAFPKYVRGDDPVPHYLNSRYANQRPSCAFEESLADQYTVRFTATSGTSLISGLTGISGLTHTIRSRAKALLSGEAQVSGTPLNASGLTALAEQVASDYLENQAAAALDEVYPGTYKWSPDGFHDLVWTYSARARGAFTRVVRSEWNLIISEMQHAAPPLSGGTTVQRGVGGPSVAQAWRSSTSGYLPTTLSATLLSGAYTAAIADIGSLPTDRRWKGRVNGEDILFEGTSGGTSVGVVFRGVDGTVQSQQANASPVVPVHPQATYGVNLVTFGKGQHVYPAEWTSGGVQAVHVVPQVQTVEVLSATDRLIGGYKHCSGQVRLYHPETSGSPLAAEDRVWVVERNQRPLATGRLYAGQFAGYSLSPAAPVYLVDAGGGGGGGGGGGDGQIPDVPGSLGCPRFYTFYQHLGTLSVSEGQTLTPGQQIAVLADLAASDGGAHLHFALGDSYTPPPAGATHPSPPASTWSMVGNTLPFRSWFGTAELGTRVLGGRGPTTTSLNNAQVNWVRSKVRFPLDPSLNWVARLGSPYHVGEDYYAVDYHTLPNTPSADTGRVVYNAAGVAGVTTRVVKTGAFSNGNFVVLEHAKDDEGCTVGAITPPGSVSTTLISTSETYDVTGDTISTGDVVTIVIRTGDLLTGDVYQGGQLTVNGPNLFQVNAPFEICGPQFWCCKEVTLSTVEIDWRPPDNKTVYTVRTTSTESEIRGIVPARKATGAAWFLTTSGGIVDGYSGILHVVNSGSLRSGNATSLYLGKSGDLASGWAAAENPPPRSGLYWVTSGMLRAGIGLTDPLLLTFSGIASGAGGRWSGAPDSLFLVRSGQFKSGQVIATVGQGAIDLEPQVIALTVTDPGKFLILASGQGSPGYRVAIPPAFSGRLVHETNDTTMLWYDRCTSGAASEWRVLSTTIGASGMRGGAGTTAVASGIIGSGVSGFTPVWFGDDGVVGAKELLKGTTKDNAADTFFIGKRLVAENGGAALSTASSNNNVAIGDTAYAYFTLSSAGTATVTGFAVGSAAQDGRVLFVAWSGVSPDKIVLKHQSTDSSANNRLWLPGSADLELRPTEGAVFIYVGSLGWYLLGVTQNPWSAHHGGTGQNSYAAGDLLYASGVIYNSGQAVLAKRAIGSYNQFLMASGFPVWVNGWQRVTAPSAATDAATLGDLATDGSFLYVATGTNAWKRVGISTW